MHRWREQSLHFGRDKSNHHGEHMSTKGKSIVIGIFIGILFTIVYVVKNGPISESTEEPEVISQKIFQQEQTPPEPQKPFEGKLELFNEDAMTVKAGTHSAQKIMLNVDGKTHNMLKGSFVEPAGYGISFYVFDQKNYNAFNEGGSRTPYVSAKRVKSYEFTFVPDHSDLYYFVFDNGYSISIDKVPVLSVTWTWQE